MRLLTKGRRTPTSTDTLPFLELVSPRQLAIDWLQGKIIAGEAGLDPHDPTILIVDTSPNEKIWGYRALELCGVIVNCVTPARAGGRRIRAVVETDVRQELCLDKPDRPWMLAPTGAAPLQVVGESVPEPVSLQALRDAKAAYERRNNNQEAS